VTATKTVQMGWNFQIMKSWMVILTIRIVPERWNMPLRGIWILMVPQGKSEQISSEGKCSIKRIGRDRFTVTFSFKTGPDRIISGEYSGKVIIHDEKM
jgi:hypothetical protein